MGSFGSKGQEDGAEDGVDHTYMPEPVVGGKSGGIDDGGQALEPMDTSQKDALAPCVFRWEGGGRQVYITGTFNRWSEKLPMHRSGNDFTLICDVPRTKHAYKFIVDGEWRFAPDQKTIADTQGNINNFVDMSDFVPILVSNERGSRRSRLGGTSTDWLYSSSTKQERQRGHELSETGDYDDEEYGQYLPSVHDYNKEPPLLPPQLKHIMLNSAGAASAAAPDEGGQQQLPMPQHVTLKHLYCTAIKDGLMVLSTTQRYRQKCVTTISYSLQDRQTRFASQPTPQGSPAVSSRARKLP